MQQAMEFEPRLPVDEMSADELRERLLQALRDGRLNEDDRGPVLGFCAGLKRPKGPSAKQWCIARTLVKEMRRWTSWEDEQLIERIDVDGDLIDNSDWEEFR